MVQMFSVMRLFLILILTFLQIQAQSKPEVWTDNLFIQVGPGPDALRLKEDEVFTLNCTITNVGSFDIVDDVDWTYENELDNILKIETLDEDYIQYDAVTGKTTYRFDHHPTSADAGDYNCTYYRGTGRNRKVLAQKTIQLTCDPIPIEGAKAWKGLREDDPLRRDYKHMPSYTMYPGDEQTLDCRATAYPRPRFKWYRIKSGIEDDDDIGTAERTEIPDRLQVTPGSLLAWDDHVIAEGPILRIKNVTYAHRGYYCCTANNTDNNERPYSLNMYFLIRVKNPLSVLYPLLCIGVIVVLLGLIVFTSEHLNKKNEAKLDRLEELHRQSYQDTTRGDDGPLLQMKPLAGMDMKLRNTSTRQVKNEESSH